jgi:hypothetical protein
MSKDNAPESRSPKPVPGKVFDVMRPGQAPANASSKPIIVSHKPLVQDRSVSMNGVGEHQTLLDARQKINLSAPDLPAGNAPVVQPPATLAGEPPVAQQPTLEPEAPAKPEQPPVVPAPVEQPAVPTSPTPETPSTDHATPDELLLEEETPAQPEARHDQPWTAADTSESAPAAFKPAPSGVTAPLASLADAADQTLADTAAPFAGQQPGVIVSHHRQGMRWWGMLLIILLIVVVAAAVLDALLDAGILKTTLNIPHTHFIQ